MTREEAIAYLEKLRSSVDICYACDQCGGFGDDCQLKDVIAYLKRPRNERLKEVLMEVRGEKNVE